MAERREERGRIGGRRVGGIAEEAEGGCFGGEVGIRWEAFPSVLRARGDFSEFNATSAF